MSPTRISIDLSPSPIRVGSLVVGKYIVVKGSKGVKVDNTVGANKEKVVESFKDATNVVKSFFGTPNFDAAVIVVPNSTSQQLREDIADYGQAAGFNITQVIEERIAVAVAYAEKAKPTVKTKLAIISLSIDIIDVSVISVEPTDGSAVDYIYIDHGHKFNQEQIDYEKRECRNHSGGGIFGLVEDAAKALLVDPLQRAVNSIKNLLGDIEIKDGHLIDKAVFVGKAARSGQLRSAVKEEFPGSYMWSEFEDADKIAAYGAAVLSHHDARVSLGTETESRKIREPVDSETADTEIGSFHFGG